MSEDEKEEPFPRKFTKGYVSFCCDHTPGDEDIEIPKELSSDPPPRVALCIFVDRPPPVFEDEIELEASDSIPQKLEEGDQGSLASDDEEADGGVSDRENADARPVEEASASAKAVLEEDPMRPILIRAAPSPPIKVELYEDSSVRELRQKLRRAVAIWPELAKTLKDACMRTGRNKWSDLTPFATVISKVGGTQIITLGSIQIEFDVANVGKYAYYTQLRGVLRLNFNSRDPTEDYEDYAKDTPAVRHVLKKLPSEPQDRFITKLRIELESDDEGDSDEEEGKLSEDVYDSGDERPQNGGIFRW